VLVSGHGFQMNWIHPNVKECHLSGQSP
jgi:hypothetical protein